MAETKKSDPDSAIMSKMLLDDAVPMRTDKPSAPGPTPITQHEGRKYLREVHAADQHNPSVSVNVDIYALLEAYRVTCPARAQAIKKLLAAGERGKGSVLQDLVEAQAALARAVEMQHIREERNSS